ncbi:MAG: hypothetical protein QW193_01180 [Nitrososphaerales archaeon]
MTTALKQDIQRKLENELERLKRILQMGYELKVRWIPNGNDKLSGEVKGDFIYIYDDNEELAINTLKHEFLDYAISQVIEPYRQVTNKLISLINEEAYRRKEKLIEAIKELVI